MSKVYLITVLLGLGVTSKAQFAPPAGQSGTTAIHKDSSVFISWASSCQFNPGLQNITDSSSGHVSTGTNNSVLGKADGVDVLSLGDGGSAILTFDTPIKNGPGWDFAVFENSFSDDFLELAFVEVSSNGNDFYRFPAYSNTQDSSQIGSFGSVDATKIKNLAGKYRANYGTPFDLSDLDTILALDLDFITHVKIIDVIGRIVEPHGSMDIQGNYINDPWPTPFPSCGFDLDAVGVIHAVPLSTNDDFVHERVKIFPVPASDFVNIDAGKNRIKELSIFDVQGKLMRVILNNAGQIDIRDFHEGLYTLRIRLEHDIINQKFMVRHE
ncbi:MAG: T9SS type A sorting domain-containing protein [Flavobacteriales bacterium]|nr:T9SS type A sorting domain-containing protein [Flavobacteriales bacterium]